MITFLTIAVAVQTVAIILLWLALRHVAKLTVKLAELGGATVTLTGAMGGMMTQIAIDGLRTKQSIAEIVYTNVGADTGKRN
jgi:hypothetical protein